MFFTPAFTVEPLPPGRRLNRAVALIVVLLAMPAAVFADAVDDFVQSQMQRHQIPGVSLAADDVMGRGIEMRGETIRTISSLLDTVTRNVTLGA